MELFVFNCKSNLILFDSLINYTIRTAKVVRWIPFDDIDECAPWCIERFINMLLINYADDRKRQMFSLKMNAIRIRSVIELIKIIYVLNNGPVSILANANPTILPSDKPHIISEPSDEIVKQSISHGNAMTFVFWLWP